jgi:hypothetical protein
LHIDFDASNGCSIVGFDQIQNGVKSRKGFEWLLTPSFREFLDEKSEEYDFIIATMAQKGVALQTLTPLFDRLIIGLYDETVEEVQTLSGLFVLIS